MRPTASRLSRSLSQSARVSRLAAMTQTPPTATQLERAWHHLFNVLRFTQTVRVEHARKGVRELHRRMARR